MSFPTLSVSKELIPAEGYLGSHRGLATPLGGDHFVVCFWEVIFIPGACLCHILGLEPSGYHSGIGGPGGMARLCSLFSVLWNVLPPSGRAVVGILCLSDLDVSWGARSGLG